MADKAAAAAPAAQDKKPADDKKATGGKGDGKAGGGLMAKTPIVVATVMVVEAAMLFAGFKVMGGGPKHATGEVMLDHDAEGNAAAGGEKGKGPESGKAEKPRKATVEVPVVEIRAPNKLSGRTFLYDVSIYAVVGADAQDKVKQALSNSDALIKDKVRTIIAQMDPDKLGGGSEPGLETLRRQVKYQLDQVVGDGMVDEVLVPRCMPFRTDY